MTKELRQFNWDNKGSTILSQSDERANLELEIARREEEAEGMKRRLE